MDLDELLKIFGMVWVISLISYAIKRTVDFILAKRNK